MEYKHPDLPPTFWTAPAVAAAMGNCDLPTLMEQIKVAHGWNQRELAETLGYSQAWVSKVLRRQQALTIEQVRSIANRLCIPLHLLRFGDSGGDDPTKRRDFGRTLTLALLPLPKRTEVSEATAPTLTAITGAQRRLDATSPARELARGVTAHVEMGNRLLARSRRSPFAVDIAAAVSEAAGFAAWLHVDMHDVGTARKYYRMAIESAQKAGNGLLAGYMFGSLAAFEIDGDDPELGLTLIGKARQHIGEKPHPTALAWAKSIEALGNAAIRRDSAAIQALKEAERAVVTADVSSAPPWPWVFPFDHAKLAGYRALVEVRLDRPDQALAAFAESLPTAQPAPKRRALIMLEVATAVRQSGEKAHDSARVDEAFKLAIEALEIGVGSASENIVQRARRFRRDLKCSATNSVHKFDYQLERTFP